ncbi:hypothetical protein [Gordonia araii]|uniref:hypothetical protein n=1 Tax=Gordonia araii TaxID=263909 RepID=UPI0011101D2D|nr:hypothetical protein [Gordonia araii]NNG98107.1 hypothetical protein [Gordonia araii NBRC 100433]
MRRATRSLSSKAWIKPIVCAVSALIVTLGAATYYAPIILTDNVGSEENQLRLLVETDGSQYNGYKHEPHVTFNLSRSGDLKMYVQLFVVDRDKGSAGKSPTKYALSPSEVRLYLFNKSGEPFDLTCDSKSKVDWTAEPDALGSGLGKTVKNLQIRQAGNLITSTVKPRQTSTTPAPLEPSHPFNLDVGFVNDVSDSLMPPSAIEPATVACVTRDNAAIRIQKGMLSGRFNAPMVSWVRRSMTESCVADFRTSYCWQTPVKEAVHPAMRIRSNIDLRGHGAFSLKAGSEGFVATGPSTFHAQSHMSEFTQYCMDYNCIEKSYPTALLEQARLDSRRNVQWLILGMVISFLFALYRVPVSYLWNRLAGEPSD